MGGFFAFVAFMNLADCIKIQAETKRMPLQAQRSIRFAISII
jgi:hypothetical protein